MINNVNEENDPLADFVLKCKRHFICNNSEQISELLECFDLKELGKLIVIKDTLKI